MDEGAGDAAVGVAGRGAVRTLRGALAASLLAGGAGLLALGGCAHKPDGPTVAAWPPPNKPFEVFRQDDAQCRRYARAKVRPAPGGKTAAQRVALATALGALTGALLSDSSRGAGVGAGVGMLAGSSAVGNATDRGQWTAQRQYNVLYEQCMYGKGNDVPGAPRRPLVPPPPPGTR